MAPVTAMAPTTAAAATPAAAPAAAVPNLHGIAGHLALHARDGGRYGRRLSGETKKHAGSNCNRKSSIQPMRGRHLRVGGGGMSTGELQRELDPLLFCRIHRSTIVNLRTVRGLEIGAHGEYDVLLDSGERLRVSRRFRNELKARMMARAGA